MTKKTNEPKKRNRVKELYDEREAKRALTSKPGKQGQQDKKGGPNRFVSQPRQVARKNWHR